ncbi:hypothetical protein [Burkholderia ubonensis]|nr:hypothetical protein [Burkholderia ubonensis]
MLPQEKSALAKGGFLHSEIIKFREFFSVRKSTTVHPSINAA